MKKLRITLDGKDYEVTVQVLEDDENVVSGAGFSLPPPPQLRPASTPAAPPAPPRMPVAQPDAILAPLAGRVEKVFVEPGAKLEAHAPVVLLDAMKMDTYIYAPAALTVTEVGIAVGDSVQVGDLLIRYSGRG